MKLASGNQGSADSEHSVVLCIWGRGKFLPSMGRLISGYTELHLRMGIIGELDITVGFFKRDFHIGQGDCHAVTLNK